MIKEEFVSFETAKLLKEVGFDVPCHTYYNDSSEFMWQGDFAENLNKYCDCCSAPTQALAARWLREMHRIALDVAFIPPSNRGDEWQYFIGFMDDMSWPGDFEPSEKYQTYEQAMEEGIRQALEMIKKNNN